MQRIIERQYEYNLIQLLYLYFDLCVQCVPAVLHKVIDLHT